MLGLLKALPVSWIVSGALALGAGGYVIHCQHVKKDRNEIISNLEREAQEQKKRNDEREAREKRAKQEAEANAKRNLDQLHRTIARLRNERNRAPSVPAAPANASRPELACFDRAELNRTVGNFEAGVEGLIGEGAASAIEMEAVKAWARALSSQK